MENFNENLDNSINFDAIRKSNMMPETEEPEELVVNTKEEEKEYDGPGLVVNNEDLVEKEQGPIKAMSALSGDTMDYINSYMDEMDDTLEEMKEHREEFEAKLVAEIKPQKDDDDEEDRDEFIDKYEKAVVVIDKTKFGSVINFTPEEHEKLEKSKVIKLEEIECLPIKTLKTKKMKKKDSLDKIINKVANITTTSIVLPLSGYTITLRGCSAYELISLIDDNKNPLIDAQNKWSLIYNKIESTSLGEMTFDEFLANTATNDYNTLMYGLLCSTYPDDDKLPLTCNKCKKEFDHAYSTRSLIRAEKMSDELKDVFMRIVDNSASVESAKKVHNESAVSIVKRVVLPVSGIIAEIYVQSAYDLINKSIKGLQENKDHKYDNTGVMSTLVRTLFIPDPDEPGTYFEIDETLDIAKTIYSMNETDVITIKNIADKMTDDKIVEYGLMDVTCPHCGHFTPTIPINLEEILFYRYRQNLSVKVE